MSGGLPFPDPEPGTVEARENLHLLPALHQAPEFAVLVRRAFRALDPEVVAVELPRSIDPLFRRAVARLPFLSVVLYPDGEEWIYLLVEPHEPMVEAARLALENGRTLALVDRDDGAYPLRRGRAPDPYALTRTGAGPFVKLLLDAHPPSRGEHDLLREQAMAFHLDRLASGGRRVLWVGGAAHVRGILAALEGPLAEPLGRVRREEARLAALSADSSRSVMSEIPFVAAEYERARSEGRGFQFDEGTDSQRVLDRLLLEAAGRYEKRQKQPVPPPAWDVLRRFSRNLALVEGVLTPAFYELVVAARGAVDDDFAWEVFDLGATWPWQEDSPSLPEVSLKGEDLFLDGRKVKFRRRFPGKGVGLRRLPVRARPKETVPGEWSRHRFGKSICSWPPEDLRIEAYGARLKAKALSILSEETRRVVPFTTSLLDGLDVRETLRRMNDANGKLWVFEERKVRGGVSSVVVVFDEDASKYPWRTTWLGEHGQESDMAFYGTHPTEDPVGPGIGRCEYGGFLMSYPPGRLADVWKDPDYRGAASAPEVLLLAALDYAVEARVVYVAKKAPRPAFKRLAARFGRQIVWVPLGGLSPVALAKVRRFHVLASRLVRTYAKDFIF